MIFLSLLPKEFTSLEASEEVFRGNVLETKLCIQDSLSIYGNYLRCIDALTNPVILALCWEAFEEDISDFTFSSYIDSVIFSGQYLFNCAIQNPQYLREMDHLGEPVSTVSEVLEESLAFEDRSTFHAAAVKLAFSNTIKIGIENVRIDGLDGYEIARQPDVLHKILGSLDVSWALEEL